MISFLKKKFDFYKKNPKIYGNEVLLDKMFKFKNSLEIFSYYCQSFNEISDIINALLNNLFAYMNSLPYYVKCICKIISIFIEKKYPNSNKIERNSYIAKFFFNNFFF